MSDILFWPLGWIYLWIRYRNKETIKKVLFEKYEDSYYVAGALISMKTFGVIFLSLIVILILATFYGAIKYGDFLN